MNVHEFEKYNSSKPVGTNDTKLPIFVLEWTDRQTDKAIERSTDPPTDKLIQVNLQTYSFCRGITS